MENRYEKLVGHLNEIGSKHLTTYERKCGTEARSFIDVWACGGKLILIQCWPHEDYSCEVYYNSQKMRLDQIMQEIDDLVGVGIE
jgi:hypothetical protein